MATASLRCLGWLLKFSLPALKKHVAKVTADLFVLLSNYAAAGAARGENFELVVMCFKVVNTYYYICYFVDYLAASKKTI